MVYGFIGNDCSNNSQYLVFMRYYSCLVTFGVRFVIP